MRRAGRFGLIKWHGRDFQNFAKMEMNTILDCLASWMQVDKVDMQVAFDGGAYTKYPCAEWVTCGWWTGIGPGEISAVTFTAIYRIQRLRLQPALLSGWTAPQEGGGRGAVRCTYCVFGEGRKEERKKGHKKKKEKEGVRQGPVEAGMWHAFSVFVQ